MKRLTETHKNIMQSTATGFCYRGEWKWNLNGNPVTRQVNALKKAGLIDATYFSGGRASTYLTEKGREALTA